MRHVAERGGGLEGVPQPVMGASNASSVVVSRISAQDVSRSISGCSRKLKYGGDADLVYVVLNHSKSSYLFVWQILDSSESISLSRYIIPAYG